MAIAVRRDYAPRSTLPRTTKGGNMTDRLSLAGWSLVRRFRSQENPLALLDFPRVARQEFGFDAIELNSPFFTSLDGDYLAELRGNAEREGVELLGIAVDHQGDLASLDAQE